MGKLALRGMFLLAALIASMGLAVGLGSVSIPPDTILQEIVALLLGNPLDASTSMIIFDIRAPRILFAAMGGALLSLTGLLMQTVSQNYLADPYILGVSSGASTAVDIIGSFFACFKASHLIAPLPQGFSSFLDVSHFVVPPHPSFHIFVPSSLISCLFIFLIFFNIPQQIRQRDLCQVLQHMILYLLQPVAQSFVYILSHGTVRVGILLKME